MKYFLSYGLLSGNLNGRQMQTLMDKEGYELAADAAEADVIVAHSAGCWSLPQQTKAKLIFYIGLPLAKPSFATSLRNNIAVNRDFIQNKNLRAAIRYYGLALLYGLAQTRRNVLVLKNAKKSHFREYESCKIVLIKNRQDEWVNPPNIDNFVNQHQSWTFLSLPGSHDDVWQKPDKYVSIVNSFAKT